MSSITEFYERYDEENRLTIDNARKIEFNMTTTILNEQIEPHYKILELGAGAGAYSFYYAE
ncbi:MAG: class I SAM-dependent methyltransferase, partial [Clostridium sp.]